LAGIDNHHFHEHDSLLKNDKKRNHRIEISMDIHLSWLRARLSSAVCIVPPGALRCMASSPDCQTLGAAWPGRPSEGKAGRAPSVGCWAGNGWVLASSASAMIEPADRIVPGVFMQSLPELAPKSPAWA
jgi:hypothetical protein